MANTMWLPSPAALLATHDLHSTPPLSQHTPHRHHSPYLSPSFPSTPTKPIYTVPPTMRSPLNSRSEASSAPTSPSTPSTPTAGSGRRSSISRMITPQHGRTSGKKFYRCPYPDCSQTSSNKGNLSKHIATRHEHRKDFECPVKGCNRRFAKKYNMLRHLSASGVHRQVKNLGLGTQGVISKSGRKASDRAQWSSMELDLAKFLAKKCQPTQAVRAV